MASEEKTDQATPNLRPGQKAVKPAEMMAILQDQLTLVEGNSNKERQRILDQIFGVMGQYTNLVESKTNEIKLIKTEMERLQKLCKSHGIDTTPPKVEKVKPKNRKERRQAERDSKKAAKKASRKRKK